MHGDAKAWAATQRVFAEIRREDVDAERIEVHAAEIPAERLAAERAQVLKRAARCVAYVEAIDRRAGA